MKNKVADQINDSTVVIFTQTHGIGKKMKHIELYFHFESWINHYDTNCMFNIISMTDFRKQYDAHRFV